MKNIVFEKFAEWMKNTDPAEFDQQLQRARGKQIRKQMSKTIAGKSINVDTEDTLEYLYAERMHVFLRDRAVRERKPGFFASAFARKSDR